MSVLTESS